MRLEDIATNMEDMSDEDLLAAIQERRTMRIKKIPVAKAKAVKEKKTDKAKLMDKLAKMDPVEAIKFLEAMKEKK